MMSGVPLPRLFAIIAAIVCIAMLAVFSAVHLSTAIGRLERMAEDGNTGLSAALSTLVRHQHGAWLAGVSRLTPAQIRADPEIPKLRASITELMKDTRAVKVKIYDRRGIAVFSTEAGQIGEDKAANPGFQAALAGRVASTITHRDRFDAFEQTIMDRDLISSYVPFRGSAEPGVFEIYADITAFKAAITRAVWFEAALLLLCFAAIYAAMLYTVIAGHRAIARQHRENLSLAASVARAEAASRAKSEFLANMSHEFRTPLNAIIGFAELMRDAVFGPVEPPRYRGYVQDIHSSGQHLLAVVGDVLDFAKAEAGTFKFAIEAVDVIEPIRVAADMIRTKADASGVALSIEPDANLPPVASDTLRLKQILLNLLSNAVKFTPRGGRVSVRAAAAPDGRAVAITVADTGIGIAPDDIPVCLAPFGQVERPESRQRGGTGLGLPLSRRLAELLGGSLELSSTPGRGTEVTLRLPLAATAGTELAA